MWRSWNGDVLELKSCLTSISQQRYSINRWDGSNARVRSNRSFIIRGWSGILFGDNGFKRSAAVGMDEMARNMCWWRWQFMVAPAGPLLVFLSSVAFLAGLYLFSLALQPIFWLNVSAYLVSGAEMANWMVIKSLLKIFSFCFFSLRHSLKFDSQSFWIPFNYIGLI